MDNALGIDTTGFLPHQMIMVEEYDALDAKCTSLVVFTYSKQFGSLEWEEQVRIIKQIGFMQSYRQVLGERVEEI